MGCMGRYLGPSGGWFLRYLAIGSRNDEPRVARVRMYRRRNRTQRRALVCWWAPGLSHLERSARAPAAQRMAGCYRGCRPAVPPEPVPGRSRRNGATRGAPILPLALLRAGLLWKHERRLKLGPKYHDAGLLFVGDRGRPLNPSNLRNRDHFDRLARLKLPRFRLHDLRHLQATFLNAQRIDARHIADRLGHSRASFTQDRYVHADPAAQERVAAIANELLMKTRVLNGVAATH